MSLREEIISSLQDSKWFIAGGSWDQPADDILEIFKKRIDSLIDEIQTSIDSFTPECGYSMFAQSQSKYLVEALKAVKKEMLK